MISDTTVVANVLVRFVIRGTAVVANESRYCDLGRTRYVRVGGRRVV